jgi:ribulose-phosphate 3-epimerase
VSRHVRIAPSILSADFARLGEEIKAVERAGADLIHVDVMDGRFVPNLTIGPAVVKAIRPVTALDLDVHLMIVEPWKLIESFAKKGATSLTVHVEACPDVPDTIERIHKLGKGAGLALSPPTPIEALEPYVGLVDRVLVMTVHPGFGGQEYMPEMLPKVETLARWRAERGYRYDIEIDGGIKSDNSREVVEAGVDVLVAGSAIFDGGDGRDAPDGGYAGRISAMRGAAEG